MQNSVFLFQVQFFQINVKLTKASLDLSFLNCTKHGGPSSVEYLDENSSMLSFRGVENSCVSSLELFDMKKKYIFEIFNVLIFSKLICLVMM